jgi:hypothetical protein
MGRIALEGRSVDLAQDQRVVESYLGLGSGTGAGSREYRLTN